MKKARQVTRRHIKQDSVGFTDRKKLGVRGDVVELWREDPGGWGGGGPEAEDTLW